MKRIVLIAYLLAVASVGAVRAAVLTVDLTIGGAVQITGGIGTSVFISPSDQVVGTGNIDPFIRIQRNGDEQGFNSGSGAAPSVNLLDDKDKTNTQYNHDLTLSQLNTYTISGFLGTYYRFQLDANEPNSAAGRWLSLDELKIFTSATPSLTANTLGADGSVDAITGGDLRYDLQTGTTCGIVLSGTCSSPQTNHNVVLLDGNIVSGSGNGWDMFFYVPTSLFAADASSDYLYLYSRYGLLATGSGILNKDWNSDSGFEEWSRELTVSEVPEPSHLLVLAAGAFLVFLVDQRRRRQSNPV